MIGDDSFVYRRIRISDGPIVDLQFPTNTKEGFMQALRGNTI